MRLLAFLSMGVAFATAAASTVQPNFGYSELLKLQKQFYNRFLYPNNLKEAESINSTVFSEDVQGRVSDTRNFVGRELNTEYIFGLFTPSDALSIIGRPVGPFEIIQFAANQNIASATTRINFTFPSFGNISLPVTIDTWFTYNAAKEISQYDATFRWFSNLVQELLHSVNPDLVKAQATAKDLLATSVCKTHSQYCTGANAHYDSSDDCYKFLTEEIRFGQTFELGMNTLLCRNVHEIMVKFRPDVHCPHIGKSGGGQCTDDYTYVQKVNEEYYTNAPWIPSNPEPPQYCAGS
ncbi:hypothetical protein N0V90_005082 [Kalmusia sp. IMI 367209]|nr:hypothetical protein N0V90_005082 [Kalmusia sp. IMI 367209]